MTTETKTTSPINDDIRLPPPTPLAVTVVDLDISFPQLLRITLRLIMAQLVALAIIMGVAAAIGAAGSVLMVVLGVILAAGT